MGQWVVYYLWIRAFEGSIHEVNSNPPPEYWSHTNPYMSYTCIRPGSSGNNLENLCIVPEILKAAVLISFLISMYMCVGVSVCLSVCRRDMHATVCVWRSEDSVGCSYSPSVLFESGSLVHHCIPQASSPVSIWVFRCHLPPHSRNAWMAEKRYYIHHTRLLETPTWAPTHVKHAHGRFAHWAISSAWQLLVYHKWPLLLSTRQKQRKMRMQMERSYCGRAGMKAELCPNSGHAGLLFVNGLACWGMNHQMTLMIA